MIANSAAQSSSGTLLTMTFFHRCHNNAWNNYFTQEHILFLHLLYLELRSFLQSQNGKRRSSMWSYRGQHISASSFFRFCHWFERAWRNNSSKRFSNVLTILHYFVKISYIFSSNQAYVSKVKSYKTNKFKIKLKWITQLIPTPNPASTGLCWHIMSARKDLIWFQARKGNTYSQKQVS